ncbi:hypothetical protein [Flagellimonas allohymeniacidonis]|uniref:Lipoprotein n=1 Tax=Flagellimonas allohymeniacidonis TaxID=2517819 RepID=A0A4Q8QGU3_9FLAO|nr:hypothetical protein [Allomuricauda hymeniacidonis]TAI47609.1 hypothetical protein EW142_13170 [Allomuricauda hymeniacidonis]
MRKIIFIFILIVMAGCADKKSANYNQVSKYYEGFKNSNYGQIKSTISDSLTIKEGYYTMPFTPESYYGHFKWDSVFKPVYKVLLLENQDEEVVATVSVSSSRFEFLKNNPLTCKHRFHFKSGRIHKIENLDCGDANWEIWQKERDSLVEWTKSNHPELDGFINDLSMKGALNYLKAIELYKKRPVKAMQ